MNLNKLEKILKENGQPKFRLEQIQKAIYKGGVSSFLEISTLSKDLRELLNEKMKILSFEAQKVLVSKDRKSMKALLKLSDGNRIETVLLSPIQDSWTVCLSSQVGCPLGCAFCATGKGGLKRNLTAEEITDQVLFWRQYLKKQVTSHLSLVTNIVYMGMGEPFLNWENVRESLKNFTDEKLFGFGSRSISVSTAGIPEGVEKFISEFPQVNLAISLHFADNEMRSKFMPINRQYDLESLRDVLKKYFEKSKRKVFVEYIMFDGLNDSQKDADKLIEYVKSIGNSYLLHVNLISYNVASSQSTVEGIGFKSSSKEKLLAFKNHLLQNKINATIRKSLGAEIAGACGQLAG